MKKSVIFDAIVRFYVSMRGLAMLCVSSVAWYAPSVYCAQLITGSSVPVRALAQACANGEIEQVKAIFNAGLQLGSLGAHRVVPLYRAAERGHEAVVQFLLDLGADANCCYRGNSPLHRASECGQFACVQQLLDAGGAIDMPDNNNHTPLWLAASTGREAVVRLLLEKGAQTDQDMLGIADCFGHIHVIRTLLRHGAHLPGACEQRRMKRWPSKELSCIVEQRSQLIQCCLDAKELPKDLIRLVWDFADESPEHKPSPYSNKFDHLK